MMLKRQEQVDKELEEVADYWHVAFNTQATPSDRQMLVWLHRYLVDIVTDALLATGEKIVRETDAERLITRQVQNGAASCRFALADAVLACKLTPEQYNFSHSELEKGDS
jgi:hypothetical protein